MGSVRILIVDDFALWRCFVRSVFKEIEDFSIVGESGDGLEAVQMSAELQPDLVLLDIRLPNINGFEAARRIQQVSPGSKLVFVTLDPSQTLLDEARKLGAHGFVSKLDGENSLLDTVRAAFCSN